MSYDVAILGAGAAGLMAAIRAAERGRRAVLLEKNKRPGVKILISGGTRCNITNAEGGARDIVERFGRNGRFLGPALRALDPAAVVQFFEAEGVATKVESDVVRGKVFPQSDRATDVLAALLARLGRSGAELRCEWPARAIRKAADGGFEVDGPGEPIRAARVVLTTGGASYAKCGTTGDGYGFARAFGHTIVEPRPALVPLLVAESWVRDLRGVSVPRARLGGAVAGRPAGEREGALLFTHFGLSGPVALDLSSPLARAAGYPAGATVEADLVPGRAPDDLDRALREAAGAGGAGGRLVKHALVPGLPERLAEALVVHAAKIPGDRRLAALGKDERRRLVAAVHALRMTVSGDRGFPQAEVTSGGVDVAEVDPKTMESKKEPGLHFAGEVLDLDGPIGGFNFQAAWSTGWLAGSVV